MHIILDSHSAPTPKRPREEADGEASENAGAAEEATATRRSEEEDGEAASPKHRRMEMGHFDGIDQRDI